MKTLLKNILILSLAHLLFIIAGCSVTEEKDDADIKSAEQVAAEKAVGTAKSPETADDQKQAAAEEVKKEEPVVEVIPSKVEESDLTVKPIPEEKPKAIPVEPEVTEKPAQTPEDVVGEMKAEPAPATSLPQSQTEGEKPASVPAVPVSTGPNHFVITASKKDTTHPFYGKGHQMGFLVNNVPGKEIVLERGQTYKIEVATDPMHDVYISLKDIGWGSTPFTEGVEGMYTYKGTITIKPTDKTPDEIYYSCRNHPYMGGKIHIINPGETANVAKAATSAAVASAVTTKQQVSEGDVNQKIIFADMLLKSKNSENVLKSNISEAIELHNKAKNDLEAAKSKLKAGDNAEAYRKAESAIALLKQSTKLVPNESEIAIMKDKNKELLASIADFEASHKENYERIKKKQGGDAAVDYDKKEVENLKKSAAEHAKKGDYRKANQDLDKAQHMITAAIHQMLNNQTIVYDLNFETAEEEYQYELKRFQGYEELVPIAVEQKNPAEGAKKLMESFVKKGQDLKDQAVQKAKEGDFPTAIAMLQDATMDVRRGLRMIGVMQ